MNERLATLFHEAINLPLDQQQAFLDNSCVGEPELKKQLELLLAADAEAEQMAYLEKPPARLSTPETALPPLEKVGPYRLIGMIGEGGMGEVFLGQRDDGAYEQKVAIKIMRRGIDAPEHIQRFRAERQILASLKHPNIAQLLDGGITTDGRPYLVMEFIEGESITVYCDRNRLTIDQRLRLFIRVCTAVQAAHRRLIVHRDIKSGNILIDNEGIPKLLDFGIAKVLEPDDVAATLIHTRTDVRLLTPAYAAPEQIKGEPVTTATDVYALGILLYELLTGMRPFYFAGVSRFEIERRICEEPPTRPSLVLTKETRTTHSGTAIEEIGEARRTHPEHLRRRLRGDLDHIVLMAIRKEPERRFGSAARLGEDIGRFLKHQPVTARSDSFKYRLGKFARRNRIGIFLSALMLALVLGFVVREFSLRQAAETARAAAEKEAATSEAIASFMVDLFDVAEPFSSQAVRVDTMRVREFLLNRASKIKSLTDQPEVKVRALNEVGHMYYSFGEYDAARELIVESRRIADSIYAVPHKDAIEAISKLAELDRIEGNHEAAIRAYKEALHKTASLDPTDDQLYAHVLNGLADALRIQGHYMESEQYHRQALALRRQFSGDDGLATAHSLNNLGLVLYYQNQLPAAESMYVAALATYRSQIGDTNANVSAILNNMGLIYAQEGYYEKAIPTFTEALDIKRAIFGEKHWRVAHGMTNLGYRLSEAGEIERAEAMLHEAYDMMSDALGEVHSNTANVLNKLGRVQVSSGNAAAESTLKKALKIQRETLPADHIHLASTLYHCGKLLNDQRRHHEAALMLEEAYQIRRVKYTLNHELTVNALLDWAMALNEMNRKDEAIALLIEARSSLEESNEATLIARVDAALEDA